jgi:hypothetical protein
MRLHTGHTLKEYVIIYSHIDKALFEYRRKRMITYDDDQHPIYLSTPHNMLCITLFYFKHYRALRYIANECHLNEPSIYRIIQYTIDCLYRLFVPRMIIFNPSTLSTSSDLTPLGNNIKLIIDSTPLCTQQPKVGEKRKEMYHVKSYTYYAFKFQIATSLSGMIVHVSQVVPGSVHDIKLYDQSTLKPSVNESCQVLGDKGYIGRPFIITPKKKPQNRQITSKEKNINNIHYTHRVVVENVFARIKQYAIIGAIYRGEFDNVEKATHIVHIVCALTNLSMQSHPVRA